MKVKEIHDVNKVTAAIIYSVMCSDGQSQSALVEWVADNKPVTVINAIFTGLDAAGVEYVIETIRRSLRLDIGTWFFTADGREYLKSQEVLGAQTATGRI